MDNAYNKFMEHLTKEGLKQIIKNNRNYTKQQKDALMLIVDVGETPEEVIKGILAYFAVNH